MTKMIKNLSEYSQINVILFRLLLIAVFLMSIIYLYFVIFTVYQVIDSKQNFKNFQNITQEYQALEGQYFGVIKNFDLEYAQTLGFVVQDKKVDYVVRDSAFAMR